MRRTLIFVLCRLIVLSVRASAADPITSPAARYVHLVLALGQHDLDYGDAFYGPAEWKTQAKKEKKSLDAIGAEAAELQQLSVVRNFARIDFAASCFPVQFSALI